ncbi:MAG: oligosaccharide flippase family protein [Nannocystaceae bacterium]
MTAINIKTLGRSSLTGGVAQLWRILSRLILTPIIIGQIGMEGYGVWTLVFSVAAYVEMTNVSLGLAYTKFTAECVRQRRYDELTHIIGSGMTMVGSVAVVGMLAAWLFGESLLDALNVPQELVSDGAIALLIVTGMLLLRMTVGCSLEILAGLQRIDLTFRLYVLASIVDFAVAVPLLLRGWGLVGLAVAHAVGQITINIAAYSMVRQRLPLVRLSPRYVSREGIRKIVSVGGRFQLLSVVNTVVMQGAKMFISWLVGVEWVGLYELADKLIKLGRTASEAVIAPLLPAFASLQAGGDRIRERLLFLKGSKANVLLGAISFTFLAIFASPILLLWTGKTVAEAAWTLQVLAPSEIALLLTAIVSSSLRAQGRVRLEFTWALLASGLFLLVMIPLGTTFGYEGLIISRVIAQLLSAIWYLRAFFRFAGLSWSDYLRGTKIPRLVGIMGGIAAVLLGAHALLPSISPPGLSPRWQAAIEVSVWSVPYLAMVGISVWKAYLDDEDREQLTILGTTIWQRLRRRKDDVAPDVLVVSADPSASTAAVIEAAGGLGQVASAGMADAEAFLRSGAALRLLLVVLPEDGNAADLWQWLREFRPDLCARSAFVGGRADDPVFDEPGVRHYAAPPQGETLLEDWPDPATDDADPAS